MSLTVNDVINNLISDVKLPKRTVDYLLSGRLNMSISGMATTFLATEEVIRESINQNINFIISHEGIYYSHKNQQLDDYLYANDPVALKKKQLIEENDIAVFRYHDTIHRWKSDGITDGLLDALDWLQYKDKSTSIATIINLPEETKLTDILSHMSQSLNSRLIRYIGNDSSLCKRIGIFVGYRGGGEAIYPLMEKSDLDTIICGESPEWEMPEYFRDAANLGFDKHMIVLGHSESEEPGMAFLASKLKKQYPDMPVHHIPCRPVFKLVCR